MKLDPIEDAVADIAAGRCVIVVDDADRENEGDLILAASEITPEQMAFVIRHTSGIVCAPLTVAEARRLRLDPMVRENDAPLATAFTISVDYKEGLTTGISAAERCATVRALANNNVGADGFVRPGHVFPLVAREGGVLIRSGHTEAAVDLARLAGKPPVGVICELVNDDGSVKRGPQLETFAVENNLKLISIADLIAYRQQRETLVKRVATFAADTEIGSAHAVVYDTPFDDSRHIALVYGDVAAAPAPLVRLHRETVMEDVFGGSQRALSRALARIQTDGAGIVVYLRAGAEGVAADPPAWSAAIDSPADAARQQAWRDVGLGAQILRDLGATRIRLLASQERQYVGLSGFGVALEATEILD